MPSFITSMYPDPRPGNATEWYPGDVKPVREGPYLRMSGMYSYWDGAEWKEEGENPSVAVANFRHRPFFCSARQNARWCGIAADLGGVFPDEETFRSAFEYSKRIGKETSRRGNDLYSGPSTTDVWRGAQLAVRLVKADGRPTVGG